MASSIVIIFISVFVLYCFLGASIALLARMIANVSEQNSILAEMINNLTQIIVKIEQEK